MSRFNRSQPVARALSAETGRPAHSRSPQVELISLLLSSYVSDTFYQSGDTARARLEALTLAVEPAFAAKAAVFARTIMGMRSASHIVAATLASQPVPAKARFYQAMVARTDDITEILALAASQSKRPAGPSFNNAMKRGFARALEAQSAYSLAKYRASGTKAAINLFDAVNLCHPRSTPALAALMTGTLKPAETWETALSQAGQTGADKAKVWGTLLAGGKLGHLALLRNLRNILDEAPSLQNEALAQLVAGARGSGVFPYRYVVAGDFLADKPYANAALTALSHCINQSIGELPALPGRTLVAVDNSGSMATKQYDYQAQRYTNDNPARKAAIFGAALALSSPSDLVVFSDTTVAVPVVAGTPATVLAKQLLDAVRPSCTNFQGVYDFAAARGPYDRIIFLTDGAATDGWRRRPATSPKIFMFDLTGSSTAQWEEGRYFLMAGLSDNALKLISYLDRDPALLINLINEVTY